MCELILKWCWLYETRWNHLHVIWQASEIGKQVHIPQQQCHIYWKKCKHMQREGEDCYWEVVDHIKQDGAIFKFYDKPLKLVNQFTYLSSNISSTESNVNTCIGKAWTVVDRLTIIWKSDLLDQMKWFGSLVNGILTFMGYLLPKPSLYNDSSITV